MSVWFMFTYQFKTAKRTVLFRLARSLLWYFSYPETNDVKLIFVKRNQIRAAAAAAGPCIKLLKQFKIP